MSLRICPWHYSPTIGCGYCLNQLGISQQMNSANLAGLGSLVQITSTGNNTVGVVDVDTAGIVDVVHGYKNLGTLHYYKKYNRKLLLLG